MGAIIAWIKGQIVLDKIFKLGKGGLEIKKAYHEAEKAAVEARLVTRQEKIAEAEFAMYKLDGKVRAEHGYKNVFITDPNIYVTELKIKPEIVDAVLMNRAVEMRRRTVPDRWDSHWS